MFPFIMKIKTFIALAVFCSFLYYAIKVESAEVTLNWDSNLGAPFELFEINYGTVPGQIPINIIGESSNNATYSFNLNAIGASANDSSFGSVNYSVPLINQTLIVPTSYNISTGDIVTLIINNRP